MKRSMLLLLALLVTGVVLAACGSDEAVDTGDVGDGVDEPVANDDTDGGDDTTDTTVPDDEPLPIGGGVYPIATLDITITHPDADDLTYTISCLGDTATIIGDVSLSEITACERLADPDVRTRLVDGAPTDQVCTEQYGGPDLARVVGTYDGVDGVPVDTTIDRANGCGISDWDVLLAGVLPPALGVTS